MIMSSEEMNSEEMSNEEMNSYKEDMSNSEEMRHPTRGVWCLAIHENKLYSGGVDKTIRVWDTNTHKLIDTLKGHTSDVSHIIINGNKLYSGSADNTIRIWDMETHKKIKILRGHTGKLCSMTLHDNKVYSGSRDNTIHIWNTETYKKLATLEGHTDEVHCLTVLKNKLYSGSWDGTIRIWNTETYEEMGFLNGVTGIVPTIVTSITNDGNKLYSGHIDSYKNSDVHNHKGTICVWAETQTETYELVATLEGHGHTFMIKCLTYHGNKLYCGAGGTIRVWDIETYEEIATLRGHTEMVYCLTLHENKLYSSAVLEARRGLIRSWNV